MKTSNSKSWICGLLVAVSLSPLAAAQSYAPDQVVARLLRGGDIDAINMLVGTTTLDEIAAQDVYLLQVARGDDPIGVSALLESLPTVDWAEPNFVLSTMNGTTGSFFLSVGQDDFEQQYGLEHVAPVDPGGTTVVVAVLDSGVDPSHPTLAGRLAPDGFDFVDGDADPDDTGNDADDDGDEDVDELLGHGTMVAGIVTLVSPNALVLPVRVLEADGVGFAFQTAQGMYWAIEHGARVVNLSMVTDDDPIVIEQAVEFAEASGVVIVAAAGNLDEPAASQPASEPTTVAVAGTDACKRKAAFSNYGMAIMLSAPGEEAVGTVPDGGFGRADGTSFAAAWVSGGIATLGGILPSATPAALRERLAAWAEPIDAFNPAYEGQLGAGLLDIAAAVEEGTPARCDADIDGDGLVGVQDLLDLLAAWGANPGHPADIDGECFVAIGDLLILLGAWGPCP